jgi:hypothetical protein
MWPEMPLCNPRHDWANPICSERWLSSVGPAGVFSVGVLLPWHQIPVLGEDVSYWDRLVADLHCHNPDRLGGDGLIAAGVPRHQR